MDRAKLVDDMTALLRAAVDAQGEAHELDVRSDSALVGAETVLSSLALVTYILDVEAMLDAEHGLQVTLVNESALSRSQSPFRTVETLADYVFELAGIELPAGGGDTDDAAEGSAGEPVRRVAQA